MESLESVFLDTAFLQALLNARDELHSKAKELLPMIERARLVLTTEAVLLEVANALARHNRGAAVAIISSTGSTKNIEVVPLTSSLFRQGLDKYARNDDKEWSLTDCISFVVMTERKVSHAATRDRHFSQAGFVELLA